MDITSVTSYRRARTRADLALVDGEVFIAGGTWLMSEPQPGTTGFVDLTTLGWPDLEPTETGLRISATCTIARLVAWARSADVPDDWHAASLIPDAANALLASFKVWNTATVGGNVCRSFAAGAMVSLSAALDATAIVWTPDGGERRLAVADLVTGNGTNALSPGEVLRAVDLPAHALRARARLRKIALAEHGRSGAVVTGRVDGDGATVFSLTASTWAPVVLRFEALPTAAALGSAVAAAPGYYTDPLGEAEWRRAVSGVLAERIRAEFAEEVAE
ncbi:FAD binding domain-containing protein [Microbacterium dauci]|uniref:FAD binding domain-containing protein n=1 Tax=Microbacterium dauci TaxID=3048008 RepID=A0ABT6ZCT4_9MICO|nr:FAD binding domain-containing protein [Microbacterium sp. LX3-4]MDJ1113960.1 FAD binding domain-containing protein [Microbacterium sp. LX3-4]